MKLAEAKLRYKQRVNSQTLIFSNWDWKVAVENIAGIKI